MPSWDHFRYFLEIHRAGSLKKAGEELGVNQTTVGRNLSALEDEIGSRLFERRSDGFVLTSAGQRILAAIEQVEDTMLGVERLLTGKDERPEGVVKIAMPGVLADHWLLPRLAPLIRKYPGLELNLLTGSEVVNLARRDADLAIRLVRPAQQGLVTRRLGAMGLGLFAHRELLEKANRSLNDVDDLAGFPFVSLHEEAQSDAQAALMAKVQDSVKVVLRSGSWSSTFAALSGGLGVGILPAFMAAAKKDLVPVLKQVSCETSIWMAYHHDLKNAARVRVVIDFVTENLGRGLD